LVYVRNDLVIKPVSVKNDFNMFVQFEVINSTKKDDNKLFITIVYRPICARIQNTLVLFKLVNKAAVKIAFSSEILIFLQ